MRSASAGHQVALRRQISFRVVCTLLRINRGNFPEPENEEVVTEYRALPRADPLVFEEVVNGTGYGRWH